LTMKSIIEKEIDRDQPVKLTFHKGRTFRTGEYESLRVDYGVEIEVPRWQVLDTVDNFNGYLDFLLEQQRPEPTTTKTKDSTAVQIPSQVTGGKEDDHYGSLLWKQSSVDPRLRTIRVTPDLPPGGKELYSKLKGEAGRKLRIHEVTYKLSAIPDGTEYLQRWCKP
jgi:hypothetical protein